MLKTVDTSAGLFRETNHDKAGKIDGEKAIEIES
jgi:hypothetical protein